MVVSAWLVYCSLGISDGNKVKQWGNKMSGFLIFCPLRAFLIRVEKNAISLFIAIVFLQFAAHSRAAVSFGQIDTFQDGTTMSWNEGVSSPNPPTNVSTGGPAGAGDRYLQNISSGGSGAGSKMVMFNDVQWTGNYNAAGVDRITAQMANLGSSTLHMRIAIRGGPSSSIYGSAVAADLPADGLWRPVTFDLTSSALTSIVGADTLAQVLGNVTELRILSAVGGASFAGDPIQGTLGVDNITARDIANFVLRITDIGFVNGAPRISFTTVNGRSHRVDRKNAITDSDWVALTNATNVSGSGGVVQVTDTDPGAGSLPMRIYRVVLLPP